MSQNIVETEYQSSLTIRGTCHQDFQNVAETFAINFDKYNEIGSSLSVIVDEEITVDIFAGHTTQEKVEDWNENTLSVAFSCTKAADSVFFERGAVARGGRTDCRCKPT